MEEKDENKIDVISVDVPLFIRLLEFAREDATDDMQLHDVAEKLIELCQDGDIMTMDQYDEIVGTKDQIDTSNMNAVEDNIKEQKMDKAELKQSQIEKAYDHLEKIKAKPKLFTKDDIKNAEERIKKLEDELEAIEKKAVNEIDLNRWAKIAGITENEFDSDAYDNAQSALPTIVKAELTDIPLMIEIGKTIELTLSDGKVKYISPGNLEGMYGGDANDLNSFVGEKWED